MLHTPKFVWLWTLLLWWFRGLGLLLLLGAESEFERLSHRHRARRSSLLVHVHRHIRGYRIFLILALFEWSLNQTIWDLVIIHIPNTLKHISLLILYVVRIKICLERLDSLTLWVKTGIIILRICLKWIRLALSRASRIQKRVAWIWLIALARRRYQKWVLWFYSLRYL